MAPDPRRKLFSNILLAAMVGALAGAFMARRSMSASFGLRLSTSMKLSVGLWLLFSIYWSIASKDRAPDQSSESFWSRQWHLLIVNAALLLLILPIPGLTLRWLPESVWLAAAGLAVQSASGLLAVWARRHLGSNWSGEVRIAAGHQLVRSGPYRFVRHPIYTAVLGMYCGTMLVSGQIHAPMALALVTAAYWRKIRLEEQALNASFGQDHEVYRESTWALIPGLY